MSSDLTTVPTATDRKIACDAAVAARNQQSFIDAAEATKQAELQPAFKQAIFEWCSQTNVNFPDAIESEKSWPINGGDMAITQSVLDTWQSELEGRGYTIVRSGNDFTVKLEA